MGHQKIKEVSQHTHAHCNTLPTTCPSPPPPPTDGHVTCSSVGLDATIDVPHKPEGCIERNSPQDQEEDVAGKQCVAKVFNGLQEPVHIGPLVVVKDGVDEDKTTC